MAIKHDYYELRNDGRYSFSVLGFSTYPSGVLKGAPRKVFVESIDNSTPEEAMAIAVAKYGEMNWYNSYISASADSWINALPDEGDY